MELEIDGPEVIEVDPFDLPTRNDKSRKIRPSTSRTKEASHFSKLAEKRLLEKVRRTLKE